VLGILGFACGVTAIVGLVLGLVSLSQINKSQGKLTGQGQAIAGIIISAVFILLTLGVLIPVLAKAKARAQGIQCMNNVRQITQAVVLHAQSNTNSLPAAATWCDAVQPEISSAKVFQCAAGDKSHRCDYAYNAKLDGLNLASIQNPAQTVMVFETDGGWNLSGGSELLPQKTRHNRNVVIGFADGHVEMVSTDRLSQLEWSP
jgi:prepilin-type processing-associated H-X9-DG protein